MRIDVVLISHRGSIVQIGAYRPYHHYFPSLKDHLNLGTFRGLLLRVRFGSDCKIRARANIRVALSTTCRIVLTCIRIQQYSAIPPVWNVWNLKKRSE